MGKIGISKGADEIYIICNFWQSDFSEVLWEQTTLEEIKGWCD